MLGDSDLDETRVTHRSLSLTTQLLGINVFLFLLWQIGSKGENPLGHFLLQHLALSVDNVFQHGRIWALVGYAFSHTELPHFLLTLLALYLFVPTLERAYGRRALITLYLVAASLGGLAQLALFQAVGAAAQDTVIGACGAVSALLVTAALALPHKKINLWGVLPIPLWALALGLGFLDLRGSEFGAGLVDRSFGPAETRLPSYLTALLEQPEAAAGVPSFLAAHGAMLAGGLVGVAFRLLVKADLEELDDDDDDGFRYEESLWRPEAELGFEPESEEPEPVVSTVGSASREANSRHDLEPDNDTWADGGEASDAGSRVDEILRKISAEGMSSLSPEERRYLEEVSRDASARLNKSDG